MIKIEHIEVWGFRHAIRGMRNPLNSWSRSDSNFEGGVTIGPNDLDLMRRLYEAGTEHRKYMRQIFISMDITAPLYWWKEFDTYKIGTTANSCSTMHKITEKEFTAEDFSCEFSIGSYETGKTFDRIQKTVFDSTLEHLNFLREACLISTDYKEAWNALIQTLPTSYNQKRTITMNYENAVSMIRQRQGHKLQEWHVFCDELWELPYMKEIAGE